MGPAPRSGALTLGGLTAWRSPSFPRALDSAGLGGPRLCIPEVSWGCSTPRALWHQGSVRSVHVHVCVCAHARVPAGVCACVRLSIAWVAAGGHHPPRSALGWTEPRVGAAAAWASRSCSLGARVPLPKSGDLWVECAPPPVTVTLYFLRLVSAGCVLGEVALLS